MASKIVSWSWRGLPGVLGAGLILVGLAIHVTFRWDAYQLENQFYGVLIGVKLLAVLFFLLVTSPTSTHALAASALAHGVKPELEQEHDR